MRNISQKQTVVISFFRADTNAFSPRVCCGVVIDAHVSGIAVVANGTYHLVLHCGCIVDVLHEAGCGVCFRERGEGIEEIIAFVIVAEDIAGYAHAKEGCESEEAGESTGIHIRITREVFDCGKWKL